MLFICNCCPQKIPIIRNIFCHQHHHFWVRQIQPVCRRHPGQSGITANNCFRINKRRRAPPRNTTQSAIQICKIISINILNIPPGRRHPPRHININQCRAIDGYAVIIPNQNQIIQIIPSRECDCLGCDAFA